MTSDPQCGISSRRQPAGASPHERSPVDTPPPCLFIFFPLYVVRTVLIRRSSVGRAADC
jgi:hypothetical protein